MINNRGFKGNINNSGNPTIGRSQASVRFFDREDGTVNRSSENHLQEYIVKSSDWIRMAMSASDHPTSGSILYPYPGDSSHGWYTSNECKVRLKRHQFTRDIGDYTEISFRPSNKSNVYMLLIRPKLNAYGLTLTGNNNGAQSYQNGHWGWYINSTAATVWTNNSQYTHTWNAHDKFSCRHFIDGTIKFYLNDAIVYTSVALTTYMLPTVTQRAPFWGHPDSPGESYTVNIFLSTGTTDGTPVLSDLRFKGPTVLKETGFDDLFALTTSSMAMTNLKGAVTGSGTDGLTFVSHSAVYGGWAGGAMSTQTFTGSFGGDIFYAKLDDTAATWAGWVHMGVGFCEQDMAYTSANYNNNEARGLFYAVSGKILTQYKGTSQINGNSSYNVHMSQSCKFARVMTTCDKIGWGIGEGSEVASYGFYNTGDSNQKWAGGGWINIGNSIGTNANNMTTPQRAFFIWSSPNDSGRYGGLSFATSSRS
jgi:hypothetical protein